MIIKARVENRNGNVRTVYYKHTSGGKPVYGSKGDAARFDAVMAPKILAQLKTIDHRCVDAELVDG